jgi:hypothetical protein
MAFASSDTEGRPSWPDASMDVGARFKKTADDGEVAPLSRPTESGDPLRVARFEVRAAFDENVYFSFEAPPGGGYDRGPSSVDIPSIGCIAFEPGSRGHIVWGDR